MSKILRSFYKKKKKMEVDKAPLIPDSPPPVDEESVRLGSKPPLKTILSLISGPLLSQLCNCIYGFVNNYWISRGVGEDGLKVLSSLFLFDCLIYSFASLTSIAAASHISYLFGQGRQKETNQLVVDLFRINMILGIIYPLIIIPTAKPVVKWFTTKDDIAQEAFYYLCISSGFSFVLFSFQLFCGILQGEGRTWLYGFMQIFALVLDMCCLLPIFVLVLHLGVWSAALSQLIAQFIPTLIMTIMLLCKKINLQLECKMFISKFSPETWKSIKVGFATFVLCLSEAFPQFALQKYIIMVATTQGIQEEIMQMFTIISRLYSFAICILVAFDSAYVPPASYAFGKRQYKRVIRLSLHVIWLSCAWSGLFEIIVLIFPSQIFGIFTNDPIVKEQAKILTPFEFATLPVYNVHAIVISFLQSAKRPTRASIISLLTNIVPIPLAGSIIYYCISKTSLKWMFSTYIFNDVIAAIISLVGAIYPFRLLMKIKDGVPFPEEGKKIEKLEVPPNSSSYESLVTDTPLM